MNKKIAINGFGRIGRAFFKLALEKKLFDVVAINDLGDIEYLAYLLRFDSVYGRYNKEVSAKERDGKKYLVVDGKVFLFLQEKEPTALPWKQLEVDIVVEATGMFESFEKARVHQLAGAKRVVLTAPAKDDDGPDARTILMGVNDDQADTCTLSSNGSCTTNSASSVLQVLVEKIGVKKAFLNSVHGYTATQNLIDGPAKGSDLRRGRAAAVNISPSTTGAAIAVARAVHALKGKFDGISMRVPVPTGSLSAITFVSERATTVEEINSILKNASKDSRWKDIFTVTEDQLVSTDIIGDPYPAIVDLGLTKVVDGDLCTVYSWYDNEFGYTNSLVQHVAKVAEAI